MWFVKLSINFLYLRLSHDSTLHRPGLIVLVIICLSGVTVLLGEFFGCWPMSRRFSIDGGQGCSTITNSAFFWVTYGLNIGTDLLLFVLPFFILKTITNKYLKMALGVVFALAAGVMISTTVGAVLITRAPASNIVKYIRLFLTIKGVY